MYLSELATFLALPPTNLLGAALAGTALTFRPRFRRTGRWVVLLSVLALTVAAMPLTGDWLLASLEHGLPLQPDPADMPGAVVILGGDVNRLADGTTDIGMLSLDRVRAGAALARRTGLPILVTGGVTQDGTDSVCAVMARSLRDDFRQPARWEECRSADTWENAALSTPMLAAAGIHSVYVVTHGWHMRRALMSFEPTGLSVTAAPTALDRAGDFYLGGLIPGARALQHTYWGTHEWVGLLAYRVRLFIQRRRQPAP